MSETKVNVTPTGEQLIIRKGDAKPIREDKIINLEGTIFAPADYLATKKDKYDPKYSHLEEHREENKMVLKLNAKDYFGTTITGRLEFSKELSLFCINEQVQWSNKELVKLFRQNRYLFTDKEEHRELLKAMEQFHAQIEKKITDSTDNKGNYEKSLVFALKDTSMKIESFKLTLPIFKGVFEKSVIRVEFLIDVSDASMKFYLISDELFELIEAEKERIFASEIDEIKNDFKLSVVRIS